MTSAGFLPGTPRAAEAMLILFGDDDLLDFYRRKACESSPAAKEAMGMSRDQPIDPNSRRTIAREAQLQKHLR